MKGLCAVLLAMALFVSTLPCAAQDPIPFNELARSSNAIPSLAEVRADHGGQTAPPKYVYGRRHWSKGGKIMTAIGVSVMAAGGALLGTALERNCSANNMSCLGDAFVATGDVLLTATGVAVTAVGATRRTTE